MRSSGRRAAHESVAVGPGLSVFPVGRARGSAGTHRAGASEGGRRGAMGAVCGKGRCRAVEHSLSHYLGLPGRPLEVPCQPFPTVWENQGIPTVQILPTHTQTLGLGAVNRRLRVGVL